MVWETRRKVNNFSKIYLSSLFKTLRDTETGEHTPGVLLRYT